MLINSSIPNLLGGVSEQASYMRLPTQCEVCDNFYPDLVNGLIKRPPIKIIKKLDRKYGHCKLHQIKGTDNKNYILLLGQDEIHVVDEKGREQTVEFPDGKTYLDSNSLEAYTIADYTFIINKEKTVTVTGNTFPIQNTGVLVHVKQASYQTRYKLKLSVNGTLIFNCEELTTHNMGTVENPPGEISTIQIANDLAYKIQQFIESSPIWRGRLKLKYRGSTFFIYSTNTDDKVAIDATDSRGDTHLISIRGLVQKFADLPNIAPEGLVIKVVGDKEQGADDFYVRFVPSGKLTTGGVVGGFSLGRAVIDRLTPNTTYTLSLTNTEHGEITGTYTTPASLVQYRPKAFSPIFMNNFYTNTPNSRYMVQIALTAGTSIISNAYVPPRALGGITKAAIYTKHKLDHLPDYAYVKLIITYTYDFKNSYTREIDKYIYPGQTNEEVVQELLNRFSPYLPYYAWSVYPIPGVGEGLIFDTNNTGRILDIRLKISYGWPSYYSFDTIDMTVIEEAPTPTLLSESQIKNLIYGQLLHSINEAGYGGFIRVFQDLTIEERRDRTLLFVKLYRWDGETNAQQTMDFSQSGGETTLLPNEVMGHLVNNFLNNTSQYPQYGEYTSVNYTGSAITVQALKLGGRFSSFIVKDDKNNNYVTSIEEGQTFEEQGTAQVMDLNRPLQTGVWVETVCPGISKGLNNVTMPHSLVHENNKFIFKKVEWKIREAGDIETAPNPLFVGKTINSVFLWRNRLGFLSQDAVSLSGASDLLMFYPKTVMTHTSDSPIELLSEHPEVNNLLYAIPFQEAVMVWADKAQFILSGGDILSSETAELKTVTTYTNDGNVKPVSNSKTIFYAKNQKNKTEIYEYYIDDELGIKTSNSITSHIPQYLKGAEKLQISESENTLIVLPYTNNSHMLHVYKYYYSGNEKLQSSWVNFKMTNIWINDILSIDSVLYMTVIIGNDLFLTKMDFTEEIYKQYPNIPPTIVYLDGLVELGTGTYDSSINKSYWDLPYSLSQYEINMCKPVVVDMQKMTSELAEIINNKIYIPGNKATKPNCFGLNYKAEYVFSQQYLRTDNGEGKIATQQGRLQFRNWKINYGPSSHFLVKVDHLKNNGLSYSYPYNGYILNNEGSLIGEQIKNTGTFNVPIKGKAERCRITILNNSHMPSSILNAEWEAFYITRSRRI